MPALAGLLIMVGVSMIKTNRILTVWHTDPGPVTIMLLTFAFTLFAPIQVAVFVGVAIHILLFVFRSAESVRIERIIPHPEGFYAEGELPEKLSSGEILILNPIGNLFFAGAAEFEEHLPEVGEAHGSVVIIRLRDRDEVGSTFIRLIKRYATTLKAQDNLLMLTGLNKHVMEQLENTDLLELIGEENVFPAEARFGAAVDKAVQAAKDWMSQN
jgi:SulP family sulfate permease